MWMRLVWGILHASHDKNAQNDNQKLQGNVGFQALI